MASFILENQENIARVACRDSGKTKLDASMGEIMVTLEKLNWIILHGEKVLRPSQRPGPANFFDWDDENAEVRYEPMGVVTSIVSWNYPFHNLMGPVIASLFTGNAIIVKCSRTSYGHHSGLLNLLESVYKSWTLMKTWCNCAVVSNDAEYLFHIQDCLISLSLIQNVAHHVVSQAAKQLTPCVVELW